MNELKERLKNSDAFKALISEKEIAERFNDLDWNAFQGPFYKDTNTGKFREIDVVANSKWYKQFNDKEKISVGLKLILECKSLSGYHLLFSEFKKFNTSFSPNEYWIGYADKTFDIISKKLEERDVSDENIGAILNGLKDMSFPNATMKTHDFRIKPMPVDYNFCAFSETNIGNTKELDNSVLWKALLALKSSIKSFKQDRVDFLLTDFLTEIEQAQKYDDDLVDRGLQDLKYDTRYLELYHPIVVIDSMLWSTISKKLENIKYCRFYQVSTQNNIDWWADIVNSEYFDEYSEKLTEYYNSTFAEIIAE